MAALERQLQTQPFEAISIAGVADAAGLGRSAFYFYFSSKHDAVTQLLGDVFDDEITQVGAILRRPGNVAVNIGDALAFIVDSWRERATLLAAMLDARDGDADAKLIWDGWIERYEEFAADFIAVVTARSDADSRALAHVLIAMNERALERHLRSGAGRAAADQLHQALVHVWQAALRRSP
ncbi:TetR/AcrR family transcriptional regulator [Mycobacterium sp. AT1]|uniref:TetR/AcrR family transcriptional regulator n=1 Tax=Mycobacterium sp. AT1 TaxID=1961706 RepID=UPI00130205C0|nr:TetR/AcrR family transcriptional regulator [Mycobacterium sp. AT1]